ncbi:MAG: hypothetical protein DK302_001692 [Chloroflexi bacterium]|jgi:hypothetical protein|nr:MAG: hypothetical protein DK302_001692 [Chloroflexota bacterium]
MTKLFRKARKRSNLKSGFDLYMRSLNSRHTSCGPTADEARRDFIRFQHLI